MPHAVVTVAVTQHDDPEGCPWSGRTVRFGPAGLDDVELLLAANRGADPRPLGKGASGGELSRVMLAVEVALAATNPVPTFVFDEVDAGVGGKAAVEVGRRLALLARHAQVLVVTHLPQVAAFADQHVVVVKSSDGTVTTSGLTTLDDARPGARAVADAGRPGGLRHRAGARRGAARHGPGVTHRLTRLLQMVGPLFHILGRVAHLLDEGARLRRPLCHAFPHSCTHATRQLTQQPS